MTAIFKREVRSSFHGMIGYVLTAFMLAATAIYFVALNLGYGLTDFGYYTLYRTTFVLLLYIPVLTMRSFAEERRTRTDQLLLTSPVSVWEIVLGKFFALCVIFALPCLADAVMILVLAALGATGTATLANLAALLCYYLMGCAAIAIGVFLSSLTENQIIAAVAGVAALLLAYMMPSLRSMFTAGSAVALALFTAIAAVLSVVAGLRTRSFTLGCLTFAGCCVVLTALFLLQSSWLTEAFSAVLSGLCLFTPFEEFVNNSFSIPTLVYYLTVTMLIFVLHGAGAGKVPLELRGGEQHEKFQIFFLRKRQGVPQWAVLYGHSGSSHRVGRADQSAGGGHPEKIHRARPLCRQNVHAGRQLQAADAEPGSGCDRLLSL